LDYDVRAGQGISALVHGAYGQALGGCGALPCHAALLVHVRTPFVSPHRAYASQTAGSRAQL